MISSLLKRFALAILVVGVAFVSASRADLTSKNASGTTVTIFNFTCFTTKLCNTHVNIDSAGAEIFTSGAAGYVRFPSAQAVTVSSGTVTVVTSITNPVAVTGTFWQATQPVSNAGTFAVQAAQSGTWTVQPGNTANTTPWLTAYGQNTTTGSGWTSATSADATQTLLSGYGAPALLVQLVQTSTISAGAVTFEGTYDGTNWVSIPIAQVLNPNTFASLTNPYTLVASTNQPFLIVTQGYRSIRVRLSTGITGSATVTPHTTLLNYNPVVGALLNPLSAGSAIIGKVGIDQTTVGTTNAVRPIAGATGGATPLGNIAANNTTAVVVKASAGTIYGIQIGNIGSVPAYLKIYNATSATCGSGTPVKRLIIPKAGTAADGGGSNIPIPATGLNFSTGITYCLTTGIADNDTTAPAASTVLINIDYN